MVNSKRPSSNSVKTLFYGIIKLVNKSILNIFITWTAQINKEILDLEKEHEDNDILDDADSDFGEEISRNDLEEVKNITIHNNSKSNNCN